MWREGEGKGRYGTNEPFIGTGPVRCARWGAVEADREKPVPTRSGPEPDLAPSFAEFRGGIQADSQEPAMSRESVAAADPTLR